MPTSDFDPLTCPDCQHSRSAHRLEFENAPQIVVLRCRKPACGCARAYQLNLQKVNWQRLAAERPAGEMHSS